MPTPEQIQLERLTLGLKNIQSMKPSPTRDALLRDFDRVIGAANIAASTMGKGGGGRREQQKFHQ